MNRREVAWFVATAFLVRLASATAPAFPMVQGDTETRCIGRIDPLRRGHGREGAIRHDRNSFPVTQSILAGRDLVFLE